MYIGCFKIFCQDKILKKLREKESGIIFYIDSFSKSEIFFYLL